MKNVFLEMERLRNLKSGLGQFCLHHGRAVAVERDAGLSFTCYVPREHLGIFGPACRYVPHSRLHNVLSATTESFDLWHCLHQDSRYLPPHASTRLILTVHDLNYLFKYSGLRERMKTADLKKRIERAHTLVFPCEFTRAMVQKRFAIRHKPFAIIPYGNGLTPEAVAEPGEKPQTARFLFSIGALLPKKNFHVLVPLLQSLKDYSLVIAGDASTSYADKIRDDADYYGVTDRVVFAGAVSDEEKVWWYKHCEAFVFPSISEGFGLPVVEAMSLGKPVFISNLTSLPEVGGNEAFYWDTFDPDAMAEVFKKGMHEYEIDRTKAERIKKWADRFSWDNTAREYFRLYKTVLKT